MPEASVALVWRSAFLSHHLRLASESIFNEIVKRFYRNATEPDQKRQHRSAGVSSESGKMKIVIRLFANIINRQ